MLSLDSDSMHRKSAQTTATPLKYIFKQIRRKIFFIPVVLHHTYPKFQINSYISYPLKCHLTTFLETFVFNLL